MDPNFRFCSILAGVVSARDYLQLLASCPPLADCQLYFRCLGTKSTLTFATSADVERVIQRVSGELIHLDQGLRHSVDVCLSLAASQHFVFGRTAALREAARRLEQRARVFQPLMTATFCNLQGTARDSGAPVAGVNLYTSFLGNVRAGGEVPTATCEPVACQLMFPTSPSRGWLQQRLESNITRLQQTMTVLQQLRGSTSPLRLEVSTSVDALPGVLPILEDIAARNDLVVVADGEVVWDFIASVIMSCCSQMRAARALLADGSSLDLTQLCELARAEDLAFQAFLYGRLTSTVTKSARRAALDSGSELLMFPELLNATGSTLQVLDALSQQDPAIPFHALSLKVEIARVLAGTDAVEAKLDAVALLVLVCLNHDMAKYCRRLKRLKLDRQLAFLKQVRPGRGYVLVHTDNMEDIIRLIFNIFFVDHDVTYATYPALHAFALSQYVID